MTQFIDSFAEDIWRQSYKDYKDNSIDDTFHRVAKAIASVEATEELQNEWEANFFDMLFDFKGVCGGRTYANAGTEFKGTTLLNCFVSPRRSHDIDSLEGILHDLASQSYTLKSEGGWGQNFSFIRPRGTFIAGVGVETPGAVKFMEIYDKASEIITSGSGRKSVHKKAKGKIRKGAMMGVLDVWHPDIIEFITAKQQPGRLTKFNVSVNCTDDFMQKVINVTTTGVDENWNLVFPDVSFEKYNTEWTGDIKEWTSKNYPLVVHQTISVKYLWNLIMESTYNRAEPGVLFLDRANDFNPFYYGEKIYATNPCLRGDTIISTPNGDTTIADVVQRFESGQDQFVYTMNINSNVIETEKITNALLTAHDREILELSFDDGKVLHVTPDHKIFTRNRGYIEAQYLDENDDVVTNY